MRLLKKVILTVADIENMIDVIEIETVTGTEIGTETAVEIETPRETAIGIGREIGIKTMIRNAVIALANSMTTGTATARGSVAEAGNAPENLAIDLLISTAENLNGLEGMMMVMKIDVVALKGAVPAIVLMTQLGLLPGGHRVLT